MSEQPKKVMDKEEYEDYMAVLDALREENLSKPEGIQKEKEKEKLAALYNNLQKNAPEEEGIREINNPFEEIPKSLVGLLDYIPGLARTAAGESALALAGKNTLKGAGSRILDAVAPDLPFVESGPFARPAWGAGEYTEKLGATGPEFQKPLLPENSFINPSRKEAMDFALNVLADPTLIKGGLKGLIGKSKPTMASLEKQFANEIETARNRGSLGSNLKAVGKFITNPSKTLGEGLENFRFRDADMAAVDAGQRPFTSVWREQGKPGVTSRGVDLGKEKIMQAESSSVNKLLEDVPTGEDLITRAKKFYTEKFGPEVANKIDYSDELKLQQQLGYVHPRADVMDVMNSPKIAENIATEGLTGPTLTAQKNLGDVFRETALADPELAGAHRAALAKEAADLERAATTSKLGKDALGGTIYEELTPAPYNQKPVPTDILDFKEKFYTPKELNALAKSMQGIAAASRASVYNAPNPAMQVLNKTEQRMAPLFQKAEGSMAADVGARATELQHETLASIAPEKGAESLKATKNMATLLKAGPYTSEPYLGPNQSSTRMGRILRYSGSPVVGGAIEALQDVKGTGSLALGKALASPWSVYGMQPAVRGYLSEKAAQERSDTPWEILLRDYSEGRR